MAVTSACQTLPAQSRIPAVVCTTRLFEPSVHGQQTQNWYLVHGTLYKYSSSVNSLSRQLKYDKSTSMADPVTRKRRLEANLQDEERKYHKRRDELIQQLDILRDLENDDQVVPSDHRYQDLLREYGAESKRYKARQSNLKAEFYQLEADELDVDEPISQSLEEQAERYPSPTATRASSKASVPHSRATTLLPTRTISKRVPSNTSTQPSSHRRWSDMVDPPSGVDGSESRKLRTDIVGTSDRLPTRDGLVRSQKAGWWFVDEVPSVVQHRPSAQEASWYVLECGVCGTNVMTSGEPFRGVTALYKHVNSSVLCKQTALLRHPTAWDFIVSECLTPLSNDEVDAVFAGTLDFPIKTAVSPVSIPAERRAPANPIHGSCAVIREKAIVENRMIQSGIQGWMYVESCPVIVQYEPPGSTGTKSFYTIRCCLCDANVTIHGVYFKGILGLRIHLKQKGTRCELPSGTDLSEFVLDKCVTPISEEAVLQALKGELSVPMVRPKWKALDAPMVQSRSTVSDANEILATGRPDGESRASSRSATPGSPSPTSDLIRHDRPAPGRVEAEPMDRHGRSINPAPPSSAAERRESPPVYAHRLASRQAPPPQESRAQQQDETMLVNRPGKCPAFERLANGTYTELYCCFCEGNTIISNGSIRFADRMDLGLHLNLQHTLACLGTSTSYKSQDQFITDRCTRGSWTVEDFRNGLVRIRPQLLREK